MKLLRFERSSLAKWLKNLATDPKIKMDAMRNVSPCILRIAESLLRRNGKLLSDCLSRRSRSQIYIRMYSTVRGAEVRGSYPLLKGIDALKTAFNAAFCSPLRVGIHQVKRFAFAQRLFAIRMEMRNRCICAAENVWLRLQHLTPYTYIYVCIVKL